MELPELHFVLGDEEDLWLTNFYPNPAAFYKESIHRENNVDLLGSGQ